MTNYKKYVSLLILIVQNTTLVLMMRYSRTVQGPMYLSSTAVVFTELLKFAVSVSMVFVDCKLDLHKTVSLLQRELFDKYRETVNLSIPSILYTVQNNLLYIALSYLNAATFQVTYQLKILTTAVFSVIILNRTLNRMKWLSLTVLMFAVILVQWPSGNDKLERQGVSYSLIGLGAVLLACVSSGFSGVYIEKILKQSETSIWIRNIQLSMLGFFIGLFGVLVSDWQAIVKDGFFQGYSFTVIIVIVLQVLGGFVVAAVMKFADNILKGFATSVSIVVSSVVSYFLLGDFIPSWTFLSGATLVLVATFMYSWPQSSVVLPLGSSVSKAF